MTHVKDNQDIVSTLKTKLEFTEKQYRSLVENSHDVVTLFDMEGKYLYLSQAIETMLGFTPEELIGRYVSERFHPDDREGILAFNQSKIAEGNHFINPDFRIQRKDGTYIWLEAYSIPVFDKYGKPIAVQTSNRDITRRKLIEIELLKSEERYRLISENSLDFISVHDSEGIYSFVSPSVKEMLGYEPMELIGTSGLSLIHPEDLPGLLSGPPADPGIVIPYQFRIKRKDHQYIWVEAYSKPIRDSQGNVISMQTSARDITVRKHTEEKLAKSERINRLISTNSRDLISLYDKLDDPKRIYISPSCKDIMGYEQDEMIGRSPFDFIVEEDGNRMRQRTHPLTLSGGVSTAEYRAIKKDGTIIWLESISNPFFDNDGAMIGFQTSARDITQRKQWEEELQKATLESERSTLKFRELLNEKNDLIGLFSHDMRSPINQIKGLAQLMEMSMDDKETIADCIRKLNHAANRQLALYRDILLMLKSDQMNVDQKYFKKIPLMMVVGKCYKNLEWEFRNKSVEIEVDVPKELEVNIQLDLFIQAVQNLFSNAIKFSHAGGILRVKGMQYADFIRLSVADHGIGFDPAKAESLFERFTKEGREGTNKEASTGLGLYLVKKIIDNHGGKITAHSDGDGKGSEFRIDLPLPG